jgi:hypothetical protein
MKYLPVSPHCANGLDIALVGHFAEAVAVFAPAHLEGLLVRRRGGVRRIDSR